MGGELAARPPRRKRRTVRGNLLRLLFILVLFGFVAVAARLINREPTLILPEQMNPAQDAALRASPDNAYFALQAAQAKLPSVPDPIAGTLAEWAVRLYEHGWPQYTPELNRFIVFEDAAIAAYVASCTAALDEADAALQKPYFLLASPRDYIWGDKVMLERLALMLLTSGAHAGRVQGDAALAAKRLSGAIRLSRMLSAEDADDLRPRGIEDEALRQFVLCTETLRSAEGLDILQTALGDVGPPWPDPFVALERYWHQLDKLLTLPLDDKADRRSAPIRRMFFLREVQKWANNVLPHKEEFRALAAEPIAAHARILDAYGIDEGWRARRRQRLHVHAELLLKAAHTTVYYQRARLVLALEACRVAEGSYPDTLAALVPEWIAALPVDPVSGAPWVYRPEGEKYALYGVGTDGMDNGGAEDADMILMQP